MCSSWLVRHLGSTKTTELTSIKLGWRTGLGPEPILVTFGVDPDKYYP